MSEVKLKTFDEMLDEVRFDAARFSTFYNPTWVDLGKKIPVDGRRQRGKRPRARFIFVGVNSASVHANTELYIDYDRTFNPTRHDMALFEVTGG